MWLNIFLILIQTFLVAAANVFVKLGAMRSVVTPRNKLFGLINFYTLLGLVCFGTTVLNLVFILQRMPLNVVIAFLSIQYVAVTFAGYFILGEKISKTRWIGISLIAFGITVVSTTYA